VREEIAELEVLADRVFKFCGVTSMKPAGLAYRSLVPRRPSAPDSDGQLPIR